MGLLDGLFGEDGFFGAAINIQNGKNAGKFRPGRRSTEKKLAAMRYAKALALKKAGGTALTPPKPSPFPVAGGVVLKPGTLPITPPLSPPIFRPPAGPPVALGPIGPLPPPLPPRTTVFTPPPPPPPTPIGRVRSMMGLHGFFGDDPITNPTAPVDPGAAGSAGIDPTQGATNGNPDAQPNYHGNAQVWLSNEALQLTWGGWRPLRNANPGGNLNGVAPPPITYPDGTPVTGRCWLPAIDLTPAGYQPFTREVDPIDWDVNNNHGPESFPAAALPGFDFRGTHVYDGAAMTAWNGGQGPAPWGGGVEPWGPRSILGRSVHGGPAYYLYSAFDWRGVDPTTAAYPWVYDFLATDGSKPTWSLAPADLWLSDRSPVSSASVFHLPEGSPFLCVDFLDALATGAHGMPQVIDPSTGVFHLDAFKQWAMSEPSGQWKQVLPFLNGTFVCATIYDVVDAVGPQGAIAPTPIAPTPGPSSGTGTPQPLPDGATGGPLIDPATGLPIDPITGLPIGTPPGGFPPTDVGGQPTDLPPGYFPSGGGGGYVDAGGGYNYPPPGYNYPPQFDQGPPPTDGSVLPSAADASFTDVAQPVPSADDFNLPVDDGSFDLVTDEGDFYTTADDWASADDGGF
jgi:hypothetical protein